MITDLTDPKLTHFAVFGPFLEESEKGRVFLDPPENYPYVFVQPFPGWVRLWIRLRTDKKPYKKRMVRDKGLFGRFFMPLFLFHAFRLRSIFPRPSLPVRNIGYPIYILLCGDPRLSIY